MSWISLYTTDPALADYVVLERPRERALIRKEYLDEARALGLTGEIPTPAGAVAGGRELHPVLETSTGEPVVARRYRRGGALRHLNRARYFLGHRALEELRVTARAAAGGVSAPLVIAAVERSARIGYSATLLTRLVPETRELASWLAAAPPARRPGVLAAVGHQIGLMHASGVAHPDLNLRNFLVADDGNRIWIIDFDRARVVEGSVPATRRARDLLRLGRSIRKLAAPVDRAGFEALRDGYGSAWPLASLLG